MGYSIETYHGDYNLSPRREAVRYIVVHYVGDGTSAAGSAKRNCMYFAGGDRQASAHYFIDDGSIYEYADPSAHAAWHVGDGHGRYGITNANSVGIEVCNNGGPYTEAEIDRLTWLVQRLMARFGVPAERVVRHYDASRKMCPLYYVQHHDAWVALHVRITGGAVAGGASGSGSTGFAGGTYRCTVDTLNVRDAPGLSGSVVASYHKNQTVELDDWYKSRDGYIWGRYTGATSGKLRYVAVGRATGKPEADDYLVRVC